MICDDAAIELSWPRATVSLRDVAEEGTGPSATARGWVDCRCSTRSYTSTGVSHRAEKMHIRLESEISHHLLELGLRRSAAGDLQDEVLLEVRHGPGEAIHLLGQALHMPRSSRDVGQRV